MAYFLTGSFIGVTPFAGVAVPEAHSNIQFNGEIKIGNIHIENVERTTEELNSDNLLVLPQWGPNTILLATFDDENTNAGNITGVSSIDWYDIFRRRSDEGAFSKIGRVEGSEAQYIDYTAQANRSYKYQIYPISGNVLSNVLETQFSEADFYGWYLIDEDSNLVYKFDLEVSTGSISNKTASTFIETQSKYPTQIISGNQDYETGKISAMFGTPNNEGGLDQTVEVLDDLKDFINNGKEKILKSRKGHIWRVRTHNFAITPFESEGIPTQPYLMNFDWVEVAEVNGD